MFQFEFCKRRRKVFRDLRFVRMSASPQPSSDRVDLKITIGRELCDAMGFLVGFQLLGSVRRNAKGSQYLRLWFPNSRAASTAPDFRLDFNPVQSRDDRIVFRKTIEPESLSGFIAPPMSFIRHLSRDEMFDLSESLDYPDIAFLRPETPPAPPSQEPAGIASGSFAPDQVAQVFDNGTDQDVRLLLSAMERFVEQADPVLTASGESDDSFDGVWVRVLEHANGDILNRFARSASRLTADIIAISGRVGK